MTTCHWYWPIKVGDPSASFGNVNRGPTHWHILTQWNKNDIDWCTNHINWCWRKEHWPPKKGLGKNASRSNTHHIIFLKKRWRQTWPKCHPGDLGNWIHGYNVPHIHMSNPPELSTILRGSTAQKPLTHWVDTSSTQDAAHWLVMASPAWDPVKGLFWRWTLIWW